MRYVLTKKEVDAVVKILMETHMDAKVELLYDTPFELLIATILSAQCTDVRVNQITRKLYPVANTPQQILDLGEEGLIEFIRSAGFFRSKAKNILGTCSLLLDQFGGEVPSKLEELITLPGVGRKTANVVLSNIFQVPAIAVDTHVFRVSNRLGLVHEDTVEKTEQKLMKRLPREIWSTMHHVLIFHGRRICKARKPQCENCPVSGYCLYIRRK
ncbi:MAG: endonuclease III [Tissierellia bacterium]|nr:endonuclease III [Tissierellia bacterium]